MTMFSYRRWRHTRGYGVHSPFAYMLTKEVVRPKRGYAFYGYDDISDEARSARLSGARERAARMLLRIIVRLRPESVFISEELGATFITAAKTADRRIRLETSPTRAASCRMIVSHGETLSLDLLKNHLSVAGNSLVLRNIPRGWQDELFDSMSEGVMLYSPRHAILVAREGMQKVAYSMQL